MTPIVIGTKITIGGLAGTGKGTISKLLAEYLGYKLNSAGNYFREIARREGMANHELENAAIVDPKYDLEIDKRTMQYGISCNQFVFEGRIAWSLIPNSVKILLVCDWNTRLKRIARRDKISLGAARRDTRHRERSAERRYRDLYGLHDIMREDRYDLVIDTTRTTLEDNVATIIGYLSYGSSMRR